MIAGLNVKQLRYTLDSLYDGVTGTAKYLVKINALFCKANSQNAKTSEHRVYIWLLSNGMKGQRLIDFFEGEGGFLGGINYIMNTLAGRKYHKEEIKISDFL